MAADHGNGQHTLNEGSDSRDTFGGQSNTSAQRGFAAMDQERQRQIASAGGRAAHQRGTAHEFTPEEARLAGRKGGQAVSRDREHMVAIGRKGGQKRSANYGAAKNAAAERPSRGGQSASKFPATDSKSKPGAGADAN